ncbi:Bacterial type II secretion system protein F domain protein [Grimontia celer]|uniref:Bacterial type II secretion system protein F domain protein n=1 Tax=Grimontia celer TaxID=1796497 RepID=A0A128F3W7_9GAMM|nr:type II secretion system F family protein [Grimontia celer]CZF81104.1 Bacterial type II secretion system protein F domain protein [Grimontia celer]
MIENLFFIGLIGVGLYIMRRQAQLSERRESMLRENNTLPETKLIENRAVDMEALSKTTFTQRLSRSLRNIYYDIGDYAILKVLAYYFAATFVGEFVFVTVFGFSSQASLIITYPIVTFIGIRYLEYRTQKEFEDNFPDALNMIASSVSAGESLLHAIQYVGKSLDNIVGREFKTMGERLNLGESTESVFARACQRFPTPTFQFFVIAMRVNVNRGGQLRRVINNLNRVLFDAKSIEMKKKALTAEARMSSYIICAIPFFFLFVVLRFLAPENYDYVMYDPRGRYLLYYTLASEAIGIGIIAWLMRSVK